LVLLFHQNKDNFVLKSGNVIKGKPSYLIP